MSKSITKLFVFLLIIAVSFSVSAQEDNEKPAPQSSSNGEKPKPSFDLGGEEVEETQTDPASEYSTADMPEDNYLARFHALEKIQDLEKENLEQIFMLNVIKENFTDEFKSVKLGGEEGEYEKVYQGYKKAMDLYYRREVIYAAVKLEENKKHINQLYEKISDQYKEDTLKLLNLCADNILILSLKAESASNPNSNKKLFNQLNRLRVAYGQLDDAEEARVKRKYQVSVLHYRVAKSYAIQILEDVDPTTYIGKEDYKKQLDKHKADNRNRIFSGETTASEVKDKQKDVEKENTDNDQPESY